MLHQIGVGSLGPVFRGHDPANDRLVAIKAFRGEYTPEQVRALADALARLVDARLEHAALAGAIAAGVEGHLAYLVQEFIVGESLDVALREFGPPPIADVLTRVTQLAAALDLAATEQLWHGALHPRDILVSATETRLTGIGVVQAIEQIGGHAPVRRPYAAPERGEQAWGRPADVFSLAAIAFELMYGRRIAGVGAAAIAGAPSQEGVDHEALIEVMAAALSENASERPSSALAFAAGLQEAVLDPKATPTPGSPVQRRARQRLSPITREVVLPLDADETPAPLPPFLQSSVPSGVPPASAPADLDLRPAEPPVVTSGAILDAPLDEVPPASAPVAEALRSPIAETDLMASVGTAPASTGEIPGDRIDAREMAVPSRTGGEADGASELALAHPALDGATAAPPEPRRLEVWDDAEPLVERRPFVPTSPEPRSRWPLGVAMLLVGIVAGFGAGYVTATRQRPAASTGITATPSVNVPSGEAMRPPNGPASIATDRAATQSPVPPPSVPPPVSPGSSTATTGTTAAASKPPGAAAESTDVRPERGALLVRSDPPGGRVTVDGTPRGVTPGAIRDVPFGAHTVSVVLPGYEARQQRVLLSPRTPSRSLDFTLRRAAVEFYGQLAVDSRPSGARVFVDGRQLGVTPVVLSKVSAGSHVIRLDLEGYETWSTAVQVVAGERARISGSLER